jgi:hypothetical protein
MPEPSGDPELRGEAKLYLDPLRAVAPRRGFRGARDPDTEQVAAAHEALTAAGLPHPKIAKMIAHWRELAPAPGALPGRQHFDPIRVPAMLPNIWLMDVVRAARIRYRVRLVGGALVDAGAPMRPSVFLDELGDRIDQEEGHATLDAMVRDRTPDWRRGKPVVRHTRYITNLERVLLPFAGDGQTVDLIMGVTVFYRTDGQVY